MKEVQLTQGLTALVDDEDFERVNAFDWCASLESRGTKHYAVRWSKVIEQAGAKRFKVRMHHFVLGVSSSTLPPGHVVDHVNHNSLDNRKCNLEVITQEENMRRSNGWKKKAEEPCL